ncbi:hypothetical protein Tco_1520847, partial [Tanacetum coccineum]
MEKKSKEDEKGCSMLEVKPKGTGYSLKNKKNKAKPDKTESGIGKSAKNQSR